MSFSKARAVHALIKEMDGPNAAARVAAARTILEDSDRAPASNNMPQVPGFAILIADARSSQQVLDVTPFTNSASLPGAYLGITIQPFALYSGLIPFLEALTYRDSPARTSNEGNERFFAPCHGVAPMWRETCFTLAT
jgi:hypothetical protein